MLGGADKLDNDGELGEHRRRRHWLGEKSNKMARISGGNERTTIPAKSRGIPDVMLRVQESAPYMRAHSSEKKYTWPPR
jgi:hypothetical protein